MLKAASIKGMHGGRRVLWRSVVGFLAALMCLTKGVRAGDPQPNLALLRSAVAEVAERAIAEVRASQIVLRPLPPGHEANWLLEQELVRAAQVRGIQLYVPQDSSARSDVGGREDASTLGFAVLGVGIKYRDRQGGLLKHARITRTASVTVHFREVTWDGRLRWSRDFEHQVEDTVPLRLVKRLEEERMAFTHGDLPQVQGLRRVLEPALVLVVTGVVTYLFYAYRSR